MILYSIRRGPKGHTITKFDEDMNPVAVYDVSVGSCTCPAGPRPTCRHRKMLARMLPCVNSPDFYCYETNTWHRPITAYGEALRSNAIARPTCSICGLEDGACICASGIRPVVGEAVSEGAITVAPMPTAAPGVRRR
jgi:hypothetical protein